ncbi:pseudouridine-5'-phosphate glycosidase [Facklamia hominis]|uniref:pseudouridine-5'-phosphate glycosidase n=1 Tax=Facklamia hominis TaxID=178214 RepID=UPI0038FCDA64
MSSFLIESALLCHGIKGVDDETFLDMWPAEYDTIVWVQDGKVTIGNKSEFIIFKNSYQSQNRICFSNYDEMIQNNESGALTASGTLRCCHDLGYELAVSCGLGGLSPNKENNIVESADDVTVFDEIKDVSLLGTSPKDMFSLKLTIEAWEKRGVKVVGLKHSTIRGYMFSGEPIEIRSNREKLLDNQQYVYLNEINEERKIEDQNVLVQAVKYGSCQSKLGYDFQPAVNEKIDYLTNKYSSFLQLKSLIDNVKWAKNLLTNN